MKKKHFLFGILAIIILFVLFSVLRTGVTSVHKHYRRRHHGYRPVHKHHRPHHGDRPWPRPRPAPRPIPGPRPAPRPKPKNRLIGGCRGTRYGCCPDGRTSCNEDCSNC